MSRRGKWAAGAGSGALIDLGVVFFHQAARGAGRREAKTGIEPLGIRGGQHEAAQPLQGGMGQDGGHQGLAVALTAMGGQHEYIGEIAEGGFVCDDPGEGHLLAVDIAAEAQGMIDGPLHRGEGNAEAPVGLLGEETVNERDIEPSLVVADLQWGLGVLHPGSLP